jgi:hypothetical protein
MTGTFLIWLMWISWLAFSAWLIFGGSNNPQERNHDEQRSRHDCKPIVVNLKD